MYGCNDHANCGHRTRILPHEAGVSGEVEFSIFTSGKHGETASEEWDAGSTVYGIHPRWSNVVDDLIVTGLTPSKILLFLQQQCKADDPSLPSALQITTVNR